jgi:ABC-2 type transport system permease protein
MIYAVILKEFLAVWRDKRTRSVLIVPPILQLFLFSFAATLEVKNISIGILNQDNGVHSFELSQRLIASPYFSNIISLQGEEQVKETLDMQDALVVVKFLPNFSRIVERGETATMQVLLDGRRSNAATIAGGYLGNIVETYNTELLMKNNRFELPFTIVPRSWFNPNLEYTWFTVPTLVAVLGMIISLALTSLAIAREREMGTFEQLLVSPIGPIQILIGKTVPALILAFIESTILLLCAVFIFGIDFHGSILLFYGSLTVFLLSVVGFGLFISALCRTQQQAVIGTFVFMTPSMMISGFATPVENMPVWLQYIAEGVPIKHFQIVTRGLFLKDIPADMVWTHTWPNIIIAVVTLVAATMFFRRRME